MDDSTERNNCGKEDDDVISLNSDDTTIIDNSIISPRVRNCGSVSVEVYGHLFRRLEEAIVVRNRLEMQNEQLLMQWEQALEYSAKVQRELEQERGRKGEMVQENVILLQRKSHTILIPRSLVVNVLLILFVSFLLYLIIG